MRAEGAGKEEYKRRERWEASRLRVMAERRRYMHGDREREDIVIEVYGESPDPRINFRNEIISWFDFWSFCIFVILLRSISFNFVFLLIPTHHILSFP
jgi:hypothetical protein